MRFYNLTITWSDRDVSLGTYGWSGWASSEEEAEDLARRNMYADDEERGPDDPDEGIYLEGYVAEFATGADLHAAPQVADIVQELLEQDGAVEDVELVRTQLTLALELLRPGYADIKDKDMDTSPPSNPSFSG